MFQKNCHTLTHLFIDMFSHPTLIRNKKKKSKAKQNKKRLLQCKVKCQSDGRGKKCITQSHSIANLYAL